MLAQEEGRRDNTRQSSEVTPREGALMYAERGWTVFPAHSVKDLFSAQGPLIAPLLDYNDCGRHERLVLSDDPADDCKRSGRELGADLLAVH